MARSSEEAVKFEYRGKVLYGILHRPDKDSSPRTVVNMVVGGPQTRVGSHRLYVQLARFLCVNGITVFRFDYEGIGDSHGEFVGFSNATPSIKASIDFLNKQFPGRTEYILWSLCDGSSASIIYAANNSEFLSGVILCNPYTIIDESDLAWMTLKHYYVRRFFKSKFWINLVKLHVNAVQSFRSLTKTVKKIRVFSSEMPGVAVNNNGPSIAKLVCRSIARFPKPVKIILATEDLVTKNFQDVLKHQREIKRLIKTGQISQYFIKSADHTFTNPDAKKALFEVTLRSINEILNFSTFS
jgi:exosortase A-associated hydrolase 1